MKYLNSKTMKYKGKKRKVKNPLIWVNWKLREQLHVAKEEIEQLEIQKGEFYTVCLTVRSRGNNTVLLFVNKTYTNHFHAKIAFDFMVDGIGVNFGEYEIKLLNHNGYKLYYHATPDFHPKKEREASND